MSAYEIDGVEGVFGVPDDHDNAMQPAVAALTCPNPTCDRAGQFVQIHADTVLPVHCGGTARSSDGPVPCGTVLHCDHPDRGQVSTLSGTLADPVIVTDTKCRSCLTVLSTSREHVPASDIPASILLNMRH